MQPKIDYDMTILVDGSDSIKVGFIFGVYITPLIIGITDSVIISVILASRMDRH